MKKDLLFSSLVILISFSILVFTPGCKQKNKTEEPDMQQKLKEFIETYEAKVKPLIKEANETYFTAQVTGKKEDYKKVAENEIKLSKIHSNKEDFKILKEIKESGEIADDDLLNRQLNVIYNKFLANQIDEKKLEEMIILNNEIELKYNTFRAIIGQDTITDNEVEKILKTETDSEKLKAAWLAHKKIGSIVSEDAIRLIKMRNESAKELGFSNFHEMKMKLGDQDPDEILSLFDELEELTHDAFAEQKDQIDDELIKKFNIDKSELMPWHYQNRFFQQAPEIYDVDLDKYYKDKDIVELTRTYFNGIGLEIDDILSNSDLYEKPGKNQHAFCIHIDKEGDVRILCNVKPNNNWMNTMLHEFGHGVYDKYLDMELPYVLREPAHTFTTEAIAELFGRFASNAQWIHDIVGISEEEKAKIAEETFLTLRLEQLVFSRWSQVMYRFEKSMYENPDQDLNKLWWDLVEKYQMLTPPPDRNEPDWASKIHIALYPCYYHNYLLGELLASQLYYHIVTNIIKSEDYRNQSFANNTEVGNYLLEKVFKPGASLPWNTMIENATGEKLTAKYYARQFVDK